MSKELATQDNKLKIYYEDESIKVYHRVDTYMIRKSDNEIDSIKFIWRYTDDIEIDIITWQDGDKHDLHNNKFITNFKGELFEDGQYLRGTAAKESWTYTSIYSSNSNNIIRIDYEGKKIVEVERNGENNE